MWSHSKNYKIKNGNEDGMTIISKNKSLFCQQWIELNFFDNRHKYD